MRRFLVAVCLLLGAFGAFGQTISSLDPPSVQANSGEWFLTANGRYVGDMFVYDGPAGTFKVDASVVESTYSIAWIPLEVLAAPGTYKVIISGPNGATDPVDFKVTSTGRIPKLSLVLPEALTLAAKSTRGSYVKYEVEAFGGESLATVKCSPASGELFAPGSTRVGCYAENEKGETAEDSFTVSVIDEPPLIKVEDLLVMADTERGSYVKYDITAFDEVDDKAVDVKCAPESGSLFPVGVSTVQCEAYDSMKNGGVASFTIEVSDQKR